MTPDQIATAFAAIGQTTRLELLRTLLAKGGAGLAAGDIADRLGVPPSTLSFHLRALEQAGLIAATRHGRSIAFAARPATLRAMVGWLAAAGGLSLGDDTAAGPVEVLFLCTRNSARSVMAEAMLNAMGGDRFRAFSAGSTPADGGPLPEVLAHLKASGHDVSALRSKSWDAFAGRPVDYAIALCDTLSDQDPPPLGPGTIVVAWPLPDPAKFAGNAAEKATLLGELHAGLRRRLAAFVDLPHRAAPPSVLRARVAALADPNFGA